MRNARDTYYEEEILGATPLRLVCLLYQGAITEIRSARTHLSAQAVPERCKAIAKACDILAELNASLDFGTGGDTAPRLAELYSYCITQLLRANLEKSDAPLAEVLGLLATLAEGWIQLAAAENTDRIPVPSPAVYAPHYGGQADQPTSQSWSF